MINLKSLNEQFRNKTVLITGGTGSLGQALTERLLKTPLKTLRILSRNENKQVVMNAKFNDKRLRFLIGDIRDLPRLDKAFQDVDIVFHAAALKHVPVIEYNPFEAIKTNIIGSQNVIDASLTHNVDRVVCIGTDKAVSPLNTYGATKLLMEKLFTSAHSYVNPQKQRTKFIAVRYGNVLGSSGSVIPIFIEQIKSGKKVTITDPSMTRFSISMKDALDFILESTFDGLGSEVFIPKLKAYSIMDVKQSLFELIKDTGSKITKPRPGEKFHEILINKDELRTSWEYNNKYVLFNPLLDEYTIRKKYPKIKKIPFTDSYSSDSVKKISVKEFKNTLKKSRILDSV